MRIQQDPALAQNSFMAILQRQLAELAPDVEAQEAKGNGVTLVLTAHRSGKAERPRLTIYYTND